MNKKVKIAVIAPPFLGHFNPTLGIGKHLIKMGYEVSWICMTHYLESSIPENGRYLAIPEKESDIKTKDQSLKGVKSLQHLYDNELIPLNKYLYTHAKKIFELEAFDAVITDQQTPAGAILAHEFNLPFITSVTTPATIEASEHFPEVIKYEHTKNIELQNFYGIDLKHPLVCSSPVSLIYTSQYFIKKSGFPDSYKFIGPSIDIESEEKKSYQFKENIMKQIEYLDQSRPTILITLGSILNSEISFVDKVISAFGDENYNILMVADWKIKETWPDNFYVHHHIPQLWVLNKVQAVICHGGHNTVSESLSMGVPVITIPIMNDQSYVATKVQLSGAGIRLKFKRLNAHLLRKSIQAILSDDKYSHAAIKVKESFEAAGGKKKAAEFIDEYITTERAVYPEQTKSNNKVWKSTEKKEKLWPNI